MHCCLLQVLDVTSCTPILEVACTVILEVMASSFQIDLLLVDHIKPPLLARLDYI